MRPLLDRLQSDTRAAKVRSRIVDTRVVDAEDSRLIVAGADQAHGLSCASVDIVHEAEGGIPRVVEVEVVEEGGAREVALEDVFGVDDQGGK